jgi:hypothetical protein
MESLLNIGNIWILILVSLWVLPWKGFALWKAARLSHKWWFIALLILNTFAFLDIIYIFFVASKYKVESAEIPDED